MNLIETTPKGIKVIVEVDGNIIDTTPKTEEKKKANNYWLILLLATISTFILFPESKEILNNHFKNYSHENTNSL